MNDNPLKQYFRRPSMYFKLPSGYAHYDDSVVSVPPNNELAVYPMTSIDEITLKTPDALFNGSAMVEIIKSCIPEIKNPWRLNSIDFDAVVIAIRAASVKDTLDIESTCPKCDNQGLYGVNLVSLLAEQRNVDFSKTLKIRELEIKYKPLEYSQMNQNNLEQFEIQRLIIAIENEQDEEVKNKKMSGIIAKMNDLSTSIISEMIEYIKTPDAVVTENEYILEFLKGCDSKTSELIKNTGLSMRDANDIKPLNIKCAACSHDYQQKFLLNNTNFFG